MNTLKSASTDYLLESGLESLHEQSMEWISDIAFWRDELAFLYALEVKKTLKEVPVHAKNKLVYIESELLKLSSGDIDGLYDEVVAHERFLNKLLESRKEDEASYREKHIQITNKVADFFFRFKALKKEIFEIVKQNKEANSVKL
ncbi:MAG TPA: hypothetical protein VK890_06285 [Bacteroidia bacterium]|jgi:hypothetical protein|nr:hypothetical protein [Bacteroidia bacterium]